MVRPLDPRLLRYASSARRHIATSAVLGILTSVLVITQALLISHAVSPVVLGRATLTDVAPIVAVLALVVLVRGGLVAARQILSHRAADAAIRELRSRVVRRAEDLGPRWRATHGGDTATLLTRGLDDLGPYFTDFLPQLILVSTVTPVALATILVMDFWSALVAALALPLIPLFMVLIGRFTRDSSARKLAAMERLGSQLLDLIAGLPTLRGLGREKGPRDHMRRLGALNTRTTMATLRVAFLSGGVLEFLSTLSVALVAVEVGMRLVHGDITLVTGLAVIMLAPEVFEPLRQVGAQFHASADGVAAAEEAFEILDTPVPDHGTTDAGDPARLEVHIEDLWVAARGVWAPAGLTATLRPGTVTALSGPSGAGKTTTAMVLLALEGATKGRILIGDTDLTDVDPQRWWDRVSWVPQSPTILPGTLRSSMPPSASPASLADAARSTGFDRVVESLPQGWETVVGQGGVGLSIGQRQRLALTRALVDDSALVVLDEPSAHLDALSEDTVVDAIGALRDTGRTVLVIAHRAAVLAAADQVIEVRPRPATPAEVEEFPQLGTVEELADLEVDLPGFLDEAVARP